MPVAAAATLAQTYPGPWRGPGEHRQEPVPHTNRYSVGDNRIDVILDTGEKSSLWWATKNEWAGLIDVAGLELEALYGGFAREPITDDSQEYVFIARRPCRAPMA
jgi:hypothetical protein